MDLSEGTTGEGIASCGAQPACKDKQHGLASSLPDPALRKADLFGAPMFSVLDETLSRAPGSVAAMDACSNQVLTIADLSTQSAAVARRICSFSGVIALYFEPSIPYIVAVLSVLRLGRTYLPVHPKLPHRQQERMLAETGASIILHSTSCPPDLALRNIEVFAIENLVGGPSEEPGLGQPVSDQPIMCILYTSGSTNGPKAVRIPYSAVFNRLSWQWRTQPFDIDDVVALKTSIGFVDSIAELLAPLLRAIPVVVLPNPLLYDRWYILRVLETFRVTRITLVPSVLRSILASVGEAPGMYKLPLRVVVSSGEDLSLEVCETFFSFLPYCQLHNYYGSTEVMGDITALRLHNVQDARAASLEGRISIGIAIDNMELVLHDRDDRGVGEIFCTGAGLAAGYLSDSKERLSKLCPFSTAKEFKIEHSKSSENEIWFSTGDMARIHNGKIFFCGRRDDMIKIAGNKVDLGHIARVAGEMASFNIPPVIVYSHTLTKLVLFYGSQENITKTDLSAGLCRRLPSHAIPLLAPVSNFLYLSTSGKIDKKAMVARLEGEIMRSTQAGYNWADMKHLDPAVLRQLQDFVAILGRHGIRSESVAALMSSNFFTAGGTSLNLMSCLCQLRAHGIDISITDFIAAPNLEQVFERSVKQDSVIVAGAPSPKWTVRPIDKRTARDAWELVASNVVDTRPLSYMWSGSSDSAKAKTSCYDELIQILTAFEPFMLRDPCITFGAFDLNGSLIGVCCNRASDYCPEDLPGDGIVNRFLQFLAQLEEVPIAILQEKGYKTPFMENLITAVDKKRLHDPAERVECMYFIEEQLLKVAQQNKSSFVITTNISPVTQDIARLLGYKEEAVSNGFAEFTDSEGKPYVPSTDGDFDIQVTYKLLAYGD